MKKLLILLAAGVMFTSCEKDFLDDYNQHHYEPENMDYEFKIIGRCISSYPRVFKQFIIKP